MRDLSNNEIASVSGGTKGLLAFIGDAIIDGVKLTNDVFNTHTVSAVGQTADKIGLGGLHHALDSVGYAVSKIVAEFGALLGGDASRVDYHYDEEWGA